MNVEMFHPDMRERAIHPEELRLKNGKFATKCSLQEYGYESGLPVPKILNHSEALELLEMGEQLETANIEAFYRSGTHDQYRVYVRGYHHKPDEMWWVDVYPTTSIPKVESLEGLMSSLSEKVAYSDDFQFVRTNFSSSESPDVYFFLQQGISANVYFSTLTYGPFMFIAANGDFGRGVNWAAWEGDDMIAREHWHFSDIHEKVRALSIEASHVFDGAFTSNRTPFEFKHDILWSTKKQNDLTLIQSRVSSRVVSQDDIFMQNEEIVRFLQAGTPIISLEPSGIGALHKGQAPDTPFILEFTNDRHAGFASEDDYINVDLSHMAGLILPDMLRGGLLHHGGYRVIAYALYWGLPISFTG